MYQYTVIFTGMGDRYAVLIKGAKGAEDAIKKAIELVQSQSRYFNSVEAIPVI